LQIYIIQSSDVNVKACRCDSLYRTVRKFKFLLVYGDGLYTLSHITFRLLHCHHSRPLSLIHFFISSLSGLYDCSSIYAAHWFLLCFLIFTALHGMQTRSSDEISVCLSVCPSVCPSVKRVHCDKMEEKSVQIFIPCGRPFSLVL